MEFHKLSPGSQPSSTSGDLILPSPQHISSSQGMCTELTSSLQRIWAYIWLWMPPLGVTSSWTGKFLVLIVQLPRQHKIFFFCESICTNFNTFTPSFLCHWCLMIFTFPLLFLPTTLATLKTGHHSESCHEFRGAPATASLMSLATTSLL